MALYKVLDNPVVRFDNGLPMAPFGGDDAVVWIEGVGLVGYVYNSAYGSDWFYGTISLDGKCFMVQQTLSALEPKSIRNDEMRNDALLEIYGSGAFTEFDAANGFYGDYASAVPVSIYFSMRGKSKIYGTNSTRVISWPLNSTSLATPTNEGAYVHSIMQTGYAHFMYPRSDGSYYVCNKSNGSIQAYNPKTQTFFGPLLRLESKAYQSIGYSKKYNIFIAVYNYITSPAQAAVAVYTVDTVPSVVSEVERVVVGDMAGGVLNQVKVRVTGDLDEGVYNFPVNWEISAGDGTLLNEQSMTDEDGYAFNYLIPGLALPNSTTIQATIDY
jgi:hypothetical protein